MHILLYGICNFVQSNTDGRYYEGAHMVSEGQYVFIGLLKGLQHFHIYASLLIRIKEDLCRLGMGARQGKLLSLCQTTPKVRLNTFTPK